MTGGAKIAVAAAAWFAFGTASAGFLNAGARYARPGLSARDALAERNKIILISALGGPVTLFATAMQNGLVDGWTLDGSPTPPRSFHTSGAKP